MKEIVNIETKTQNTLKDIFKVIKKDWPIYILLLPMIVWYVLWIYKPMGGLLIAFKDYDVTKGFFGSDFVGFANFKNLMFGTYQTEFWRAFRNTFVISLYGLIFGFPVPIILALFFSEITNNTYRKISQTITYLPHFLSEVTITGLIGLLLLNVQSRVGIIAQFLINIGAITPDTAIQYNPDFFRQMYIITGIWKEAGYSSIVYFAAIMSISPVLYEAIKIDGGSKLQQIRYVTFPGMAPTLIIMIILRIGRMLSIGYERIILLYKASTYETGDVLSSFAFRIGLEKNNNAIGAASGMFNSLIGFALVMSANYISRQISETSLW